MSQFGKNLNTNKTFIFKCLTLTVFAVAIILRLFYFWEWSLTNDEISALHRLRFDSFKDLISLGIMEDGHPAFVQLFLYVWTGIFGTSPLAIRLPFVLVSIGSCYYLYQFTKTALNKNAAVGVLACFSISLFFITYGQIARPYSIGLFFILGFAYHGLKLIQQEHPKALYWPFIVFGLLSITTHYFAAMQAVIIGLAFLFLAIPKQLKAYIKSSAVIVLLFLPHVPITMKHLSIGGVNWVPLPDDKFLDGFFAFVSNHSELLYFSILLVPLATLAFKCFNLKNKWSYILPFLFVVPYQIALYYSLNYTPVLQASTLIFSSPFLLIAFFSIIKDDTPIWFTTAVVAIILGIGGYSLLDEGKIYERKFSDFKSVTRTTANWSAQHQGKFLHFSNSNNSDYLNYYLDDNEEHLYFDIDRFKGEMDIVNARDLIKSTDKSLAILSFANVRLPLEVYEFVKSSYNSVKEEFRGFNSQAILLAKSEEGRDTLLSIRPSIEEGWALNGVATDSSDQSVSYNSLEGSEYLMTLNTPWSKVNQGNKSLVTTIELKHSEPSDNIILVASLENAEGSVFWRGLYCKPYFKSNEWYEVKYVLEPNPKFKDTDIVKVYLWNRDKIQLKLKNFRLESFTDSDYNFYD